jgi:hypothetical protein
VDTRTMLPNTRFTARGERAGNSKLTEGDVIEMRERYAREFQPGRRSVTMRELAQQYGVSVVQVQRILHRQQWTHV